jgi:hypothetical protein
MKITIHHALYALGTVLGAAGIGFGGFKLYQLLHPPYTELGTVESGCDLHRAPCVAVLPGGAQLSFSIAPRPIPLVTPLTLEVRVSGLETKSVEVDFVSPDMNMGYNRPALARAAPDTFRGTAVLPVCVRSRMTWRALVLAHTGRGTFGVPFAFETVRAGARPGA